MGPRPFRVHDDDDDDDDDDDYDYDDDMQYLCKFVNILCACTHFQKLKNVKSRRFQS